MDERWDARRVRAFALGLPEAHEASHMGTSDLRVRNKIFATFPPGATVVNVKTTPIALDMFLRSDPETFRDAWGGRWVAVDLGRVTPADLRELLLEGYCLAAPKSLATRARAEVPRG